MASGDKEHRMLFDIRGRRRNVVKVVYAVLAILMGTSLFLTVGPFNLGEIFSNNQDPGAAAEPFEEQAERIEAKLKKEPQNSDLLLSLTRAQINTANALVQVEPNGRQVMTLGAIQQYQQANETWSEYLKATDEPAAGLAQLVAPAMINLAETSKSVLEARRHMDTAREAQEIVAKQRPNINSFSTLAYYTYFTGDFKAAEEARAKAKSLTKEKFERDAIDKQLNEIRTRAKEFDKNVAQFEKQIASGGEAGGGGESEVPAELEKGEGQLGAPFGGLLTE